MVFAASSVPGIVPACGAIALYAAAHAMLGSADNGVRRRRYQRRRFLRMKLHCPLRRKPYPITLRGRLMLPTYRMMLLCSLIYVMFTADNRYILLDLLISGKSWCTNMGPQQHTLNEYCLTYWGGNWMQDICAMTMGPPRAGT